MQSNPGVSPVTMFPLVTFLASAWLAAIVFYGDLHERGPHQLRRLGDYVEAAKWAREAADRDCTKLEESYCIQGSRGLLAAAYFFGRGVPHDYLLAHMWANLAAASLPAGSIPAKLRDDVEAKMTPPQIAEAQRLARLWKPRVR
jgi:TPR repeat protein